LEEHGTLLEMGFMVIPPLPPYLFKPQKGDDALAKMEPQKDLTSKEMEN
jgi:hypothetical protein